jgi:hypothetical protein
MDQEQVHMAFGYEYWMVNLSDFDPNSFLLFVRNPKGQTKLRNYVTGVERVVGQPSSQEVFGGTEKKQMCFQVDPHNTADHAYWHKATLDFNARYLPSRSGIVSSIVTSDLPARDRKQPRCVHGQARRGSQKQLQDYVNQHEASITAAVMDALPAAIREMNASLTWVSPLARHDYVEYRDGDFLDAVGLDNCRNHLARFWPPGGPSWDALAIVSFANTAMTPGVILVEAKSHISEIYGGGCQAGPRPRSTIENALDAAKQWCGASRDTDWMGPLYQSANRLAHLYFLRERLHRPAWLVNLFFLDDPIGPADRAELRKVQTALGLTSSVPFALDVFLPALPPTTEVCPFEKDDCYGNRDTSQYLSEQETARTPGFGRSTQGREVDKTSWTNPVVAWAERWMAHARHSGKTNFGIEDRIEQIAAQWREPVPGIWERDVDARLLLKRYQRGDCNAPHPGEHTIEHDILCRHFESISCYGEKLLDGVNALPLVHNEMGGRNGNVEADLLLLAQNAQGYRMFLCEVKSASNDAWHAAVENLRQLKLLLSGTDPLRLFTKRNPSLPLPSQILITALVLAPPSFYSSGGRKGNAMCPAIKLLTRFNAEFGVDARLAVWDSHRLQIRDWTAPMG